jgi:hypothetical protein
MRFSDIARRLGVHALACAVVGLLFIAHSQAAIVLTRPALQVILGGPGTLEDFESYNIGVGNAVVLNTSVLNNATIANGQGPGLVIPGVTFTDGSNLQWDGAGYYGSPSKEILGNGQPLAINFSAPTIAFGVDLREFLGYPDVARVDVYAPDDTTLIGSIPGIVQSGTGVPVFAGWEDAGGIGRVVISGVNYNWTPIIDNLEFGRSTSGVPELSSALVWAMMTVGGVAVAWRRRAVSV